MDQLNLVDNIQEPCAVDHEPHPVIVPPGLPDDPDVDVKDIGAWVIMKSFGARAAASLEAYCLKAKCSDETFRVYQRNLAKAGWMTLVSEGRPPKPGEAGSPRLWWMSRVKGEAPPLSAFGQGSKNPAPAKSQPHKNPDPKQEGLIGKQVSKKEIAPGAKAKHLDERAFWQKANLNWMAWLKGKGQPEKALTWPTATGFQARLTKHLAAVGAEELGRRWSNYLNSAWPPSKSMLNFAFDVDKWVAVDNGRKGGYVAVTGVGDFDGGEG